MKAKGSTIKRRVVCTVITMVSTLFLSGSIPAFAHRLDDDSFSGPSSVAPPAAAHTTVSAGSWIITLIVVAAAVALAAALVGRIRFHRTRGRIAGAGA